jgi:ADP-heptose:LPS heptosyltransferase
MEKTPDIYCSAEDMIWATDFLNNNWIKPTSVFVCMNLEASPKWQSKRWPVECFLHVADKLAQELSVRVVIIGVDPKDISNVIFMKRSKAKPVSAVGKTNIGQLTALIEKSSLVITGDSAPMHVAAGVQTPFIGLFGPTSEKRHVAPVKNSKIIFAQTKCRPCYKPTCNKGYICMHEIDPDRVLEECKKMLKTKIKEI